MKLVVGNQKAYLNREETEDFISYFKNDSKVAKVVVCPTNLGIELFSKSNFLLGAQDVSINTNGAFTGEATAKQLKSFGVNYCLVGHSERREYHNEEKELLIKKIKKLLEENIVPIYCIGEKLTDKNEEITKDVLGKQILEVFDDTDREKLKDIIIAYEPIWSIGTGKVPTNEEIKEVIAYIKDLVSDKYDTLVKVLYGGSVNKNNIGELSEISVVDGYLIGGASSKKEEFATIIKENEKAI